MDKVYIETDTKKEMLRVLDFCIKNIEIDDNTILWNVPNGYGVKCDNITNISEAYSRADFYFGREKPRFNYRRNAGLQEWKKDIQA